MNTPDSIGSSPEIEDIKIGNFYFSYEFGKVEVRDKFTSVLSGLHVFEVRDGNQDDWFLPASSLYNILNPKL